MAKSIPIAGTHRGQLSGDIVIYEADSGSLCAAVPVKIVGGDIAWQGKHTITIVKSNGEIQKRSCQTLKEVFGWDGIDPFWLAETDLSGVEFDIVGERENWTPQPSEDNPAPEETEVFKVQWLNPPGGGGAAMPEAADKKTIMNKYGSKFSALFGKPAAKPAAKAAPAAAAAPPAASAKKSPPMPGKRTSTDVGTGKTSTMEEAWAKCAELYPDDEASAGTLWYGELEKMFPGKTNTDLGPKDWGKFQAVFEDLKAAQ